MSVRQSTTSVTAQPLGPGRSAGGALYDVLELILDRGLVIDVFVRVALVGIEVLTIDARVVVASVDTYLRFAEACNRLDLGSGQPVGLPGLVGKVTESVAEGKTKGAIEGATRGAIEGVGEAIVDGFKDIVGGKSRKAQ
jgi:gas vesicle structural protein